jgi:hypothetical protein
VLFLEGSTAYLINPVGGDTSVYAYGTNHDIFEGHYRSGSYKVNRVRVEGLGVIGEEFEWWEISKYGDILQIVEDLNAYTIPKTHERGDAYLRQADIESLGGIIRVPVNCGQQLYDVIDITDTRVNPGVIKRRVLGISLAYVPLKGIYEQKILLGDV